MAGKRIKYWMAILAAFSGSLNLVLAQTDTLRKTSLAEARILNLKTTWSGSSNPASLSFFDFNKRIATAYIYDNISSGNYHLFQLGKSDNQYGFFTNGYINLNKWKFYGNFNYFSVSEKNVRWVDVMEPNNNNPYTLGDSIGGNYSKEYFNMEGKGAYRLSQVFSFGFDLGYMAGVGAKRKDPRPENTLSKFSIQPGIVAILGKIRAGAGFRYETGKEDIDITTVTSNKFDLFHFKGLGTFSTTQEKDHQSFESELFGGNMQVNFIGHSFENLTEVEFSKKTTDIKRGTTYPLQVVLLKKYETKATSTFLFNSSMGNINRLTIFYQNKRIYGNEPVVEPKLEEVNYQWSTVAKYTLYWDKTINFGVDYSWYKLTPDNNINWGATFGCKLTTSETTYYFVPEFSRQKLNLIQFDGHVEKGFKVKSWETLLSGEAGYHSGFNCSLVLPAEPSLLTTINQEFVNHDFDYYKTGLWQLGMSVQFGKNLKIYKTPLQLFFDAGYRLFISGMEGNQKRQIIEFKLGMNF
jgi:hypothetical protein